MMSKAEDLAEKAYPQEMDGYCENNAAMRVGFKIGYNQAEKDVAESFARIIRGNLGGIGNGIQNMFEASTEYAATGEILANGKEMIDFQKQKAFIDGAKWQMGQEEIVRSAIHKNAVRYGKRLVINAACDYLHKHSLFSKLIIDDFRKVLEEV